MKKRKWTGYLLGIVVFVLAGIFLTPLVCTLWESFQVDGKLTLAGYKELLFDCFPVYRLFWNSVIYAAVVTVGLLLVSVPAAFAFRFARFPGKKIVYVIYIVLMMMPLQVMILPNYIGLRDLKLLNTPWAIILPLMFAPMGTVIVKQYMENCDVQVIEAARMETNSVLRILWHCILPQIRVCLLAVALFFFAETWNIVEQPMLYVDRDSLRTLSTFFSQREQYHEAVLSPASVLFMIPVLLWYLMYHRELKDGLKLG